MKSVDKLITKMFKAAVKDQVKLLTDFLKGGKIRIGRVKGEPKVYFSNWNEDEWDPTESIWQITGDISKSFSIEDLLNDLTERHDDEGDEEYYELLEFRASTLESLTSKIRAKIKVVRAVK